MNEPNVLDKDAARNQIMKPRKKVHLTLLIMEFVNVKRADQARALGVSVPFITKLHKGAAKFPVGREKQALEHARLAVDIAVSVVGEAITTKPELADDPSFWAYANRVREAQRLLEVLERQRAQSKEGKGHDAQKAS